MIQEFAPYIGVPYKFRNGPDRIPVTAEGIEEANCQWWIHFLYLNRLGVKLPDWLLSAETHGRNGFFVPVNYRYHDPLEGDILLFARQRGGDPRKIHLAYHTGQFDENSKPLVFHTTPNGGTEIVPFSIIPLDQKHREYLGARRLKKRYWSDRMNMVLGRTIR